MTFLRSFRDRQPLSSSSAVTDPIRFDTDWDHSCDSSSHGGTKAFHESIMAPSPQPPPPPKNGVRLPVQLSPTSTLDLIEIVSSKMSCTDSLSIFQPLSNTTNTMKDDEEEYNVDCRATPKKKNKTQKIVGSPKTVKRNKTSITTNEVKSVRFQEQLVTEFYVIPRMQAKDSEHFFYKARDFQRFRRDIKRNLNPGMTKVAPNSSSTSGSEDEEVETDPVQNPIDSGYCMDVVRNLERIGKESFTAGFYTKSLEAFSHSLRMQTEAPIPIDQLITSSTIHCIADIYTKLRRWTRGLEMYFAALEVLNQMTEESSKSSTMNNNEKEVHKWRLILHKKITTVQNYLGNSNTNSSEDDNDCEIICL